MPFGLLLAFCEQSVQLNVTGLTNSTGRAYKCILNGYGVKAWRTGFNSLRNQFSDGVL
jgi:hypothetical protein